jgi:hypothetical protein
MGGLIDQEKRLDLIYNSLLNKQAEQEQVTI